jgi:transmembrane sensor
MTEPRRTYTEYIDNEVDEARLAQNLCGVRAKQEHRRLRRAQIGASLATVTVCALVFLIFGEIRSRRLSVPGPLTMRSERGLIQSINKGDVLKAGKTWLDDGSRITVGSDSRVEMVENTGGRIHGVLREGWARFEVNPGGPRRWVIDTGAFEVEVIGTAFTLSRRAEGARVRVHHGRVQVRGALVSGGAFQLVAGGQYAAVSHNNAKRRQAMENTVNGPTEPGPADLSGALFSPSATGLPTSGALTGEAARDTRNSGAQALHRADQLRAGGRLEQAARVLARELNAHPHGRDAGLVALTLAQLQLDALGLPAEAARSFSRAAQLPTLPSALREQAVARRVEALAQAGLVEEANQAAAAYTRAYANGAWTDAVRRWARATRPVHP